MDGRYVIATRRDGYILFPKTIKEGIVEARVRGSHKDIAKGMIDLITDDCFEAKQVETWKIKIKPL